jgi:formylglycine-generating enzyme required for sulfatase activity
VLTLESVVHVHRKVHWIDSNGVKPACPGCGSAPAQTVTQHDCAELGFGFITARRSCLFCDLQLVASDAPQQNEATGVSCQSCGAELVAPFRFCRKCGKAQPQTQTAANEEEFVDEDPTDEDPTSEELNDQQGFSGFDEPAAKTETAYSSAWDYSVAPGPSKRRLPWVIGGAVALLTMVILIAVAVTNSNRAPLPARNEPRIPEAPPGMVYIAGGEFMMGNNAGDEYEKPAHKVSVAPFFMDITEVTCEQYLKFLTATIRRDPDHWTKQTCRGGTDKQPVTGVDWNDAKAYADWANKRLPTEEEWEFTARGVQGAKYPWGNEWRSNAANASDSSAQRLTEVGSYPNGKTSTGVMDLIGNAWEWTSSDVAVYPGGSLSSPIQPNVKVIRGGSWREGNNEATGTYRGYLHIADAEDYSATGFRCVKNIVEPPRSGTSKP